MHKILVIEDAEESKELIFRALLRDYDLIWAPTLSHAKDQLAQDNSFSLILLDIGLPDGDGFHFFSFLQNQPEIKNIPVIFLTAKSNLSDKVLGISLGAEDYIVKPFEADELRARVDLRVRKFTRRTEQSRVLQKGPIEVHINEQRAYLLEGAQKSDLRLTPSEFKLLLLFITFEEQVFSRDQLIDKIWGSDVHLTDRCVDTHVYALRKKMGSMGQCIESIYGQGYRFTAKKETKRAG